MMRNILTLLIVAAIGGAAAADDLIRFKDPKQPEAKGEVIAGNYKTLEYDVFVGETRARQKIDANEVAEITLDPNRMTFNFSSAVGQMERGDYTGAATRFKRVTSEPRASDFLKQTAGINVVRCLYNARKYKEALATIKTLRQERPDTFYLRETYDLQYRSALALNDAAAVANAVNSLRQRAQSESLRSWLRDADLMQGRVLELQGKWREALRIHQKYVLDKEAGTDAMMGELRCLAALKDWRSLGTKADASLGRVKGKRADGQFMTAVFNAKAASELNTGRIREAFLNYMRGVAVYGRGVLSPENEAATGGAAVACAKYAASLKDATKKKLYLGRAKELASELKGKYGNSPLVKEAAAAISAVK